MMLAHLLKLTWKRKTRHLLLSLEIALAFAVVFAVLAIAIYHWGLYHQPIGFKYDNIWTVTINRPLDLASDKPEPTPMDGYRRALMDLGPVESVTFSGDGPYTMSIWDSHLTVPGSSRNARTHLFNVSDQFGATMGMPLIAGRDFSQEDAADELAAAIINRRLAKALFGDENPLGRTIASGYDPGNFKVIGVVEDFRNRGELMTPVNFAIFRQKDSESQFLNMIHVRLRPGTPRSFEAALNERLRSIRSDWTYKIEPLRDKRASIMKLQASPWAALTAVTVFLLLMVAVGLFGVLWQNLARRTPEFGLRRALGAPAASIWRQIMAEQCLLASIGMVVALALLAQLPLVRAFDGALDWGTFGLAAGLSMGLMYLLCLSCSVYPAWRASRLSPVQALRHE
jgi:putative ABC transport system permease protein